MDYGSYFNKLLEPCAVTIQNYIWALEHPFLHNQSECALLIYCTIYLTKGLLIMFLSITYRLREYFCKNMINHKSVYTTKICIYFPSHLVLLGVGVHIKGLCYDVSDMNSQRHRT